jgi:hypothetical protein
MSKSYEAIKKELEHLRKGIKPTKEFEAYEEKRTELCKKFAQLDEKGSPIIEDNAFKIKKDKMEEFEAELEILKADNKQHLEDYDAAIKEYEKVLDEEVSADFKLSQIALSKVPEDITTAQYNAIKELIVD